MLYNPFHCFGEVSSKFHLGQSQDFLLLKFETTCSGDSRGLKLGFEKLLVQSRLLSNTRVLITNYKAHDMKYPNYSRIHNDDGR